uniref:Uncharacterized protein n=2 Tax=Sus scrofa TaxID=9823 RepID=A0A8D1QFR6_PIG
GSAPGSQCRSDSISLVSPQKFNSYTLTAGMNCVLATYGGIALRVLYFDIVPNHPKVETTQMSIS